MEKIYSRKRIKLPKFCFNSIPNRKMDKRKQILCKIGMILIISIFFMAVIINFINPIIDKLCLDESKKKATIISNREATNVMSNYSYEDMVTIYRGNDNNVTMIKSNIIVINEIISDVAIKIQEAFKKDTDSTIEIRLRKFKWYKIFIRSRSEYTYKNFNIRNSFNKSKK